MFKADTKTKEIFIYDDIGPSWAGMIDAGMVIDGLSQMEGERVTVRINSMGGSVVEMTPIYNALKRHQGGVDVVVDGLAASAASYIAMAGEMVTIAENGLFMLHWAWTVAAGNASDFRKMADDLEVIGEAMLGAYVERSNLEESEVREILDNETWLGAAESVEKGFADKIGSEVIEDVVIAKAKVEPRQKAHIAAHESKVAPHRTAASIRARQNRIRNGL